MLAQRFGLGTTNRPMQRNLICMGTGRETIPEVSTKLVALAELKTMTAMMPSAGTSTAGDAGKVVVVAVGISAELDECGG
ncbi:hypothetical protein NL676_020508 [Syzygium grande]|nr:hypothetical protein NL676_020508 [Syzygium grande]